MGPISLGFEEARQISESMMEHLCLNYQEGMTREELQQVRWCLKTMNMYGGLYFTCNKAEISDLFIQIIFIKNYIGVGLFLTSSETVNVLTKWDRSLMLTQ